MDNGILNFSLGMQDAGFTRTLAAADRSMLGTREKAELLRHGLDSMGGGFAALSNLSRLALDPITLGFAAGFAAVELFKHSVEQSEAVMKAFLATAKPVENIMRGILDARPTNTDDWAEWVEQIGKLIEKNADVKSLGDAFNDMFKGVDTNTAAAEQEQLDLEQQKIELLRDQGRISAADAAARIEALKDQAVLQKNLSERTGIQNEIKRREGELGHINELAGQTPDEATAAGSKITAENRVADSRKQMEDLPKAIAANQRVIATAEENSKIAGPNRNADWWIKGNQAKARNQQLQSSLLDAQSQFPGAVKAATSADEDFNNAKSYKSRAHELNQTIAGLKNALGVTVDRQNKMTPMEFEKNHLTAMEKSLKDNHYKPEFTSFEKMGFVMSGAGNPMKETNQILRSILAKFNPGPQAGGAYPDPTLNNV